MKIREAILQEHSREQCDKIVAWIGNSQNRFDELFSLFMNDENTVVQRSAWPVSYCVEARPVLIKKHFKELVNKLRRPVNHDAVKRNSIRLFQYVEIPEEWQGAIMDICFDYLASPKERVGTKAFCITVLGNLAKTYPEIIPELKMIIEDQLPGQTAAFKSRAQKTLNQLMLP